MKQNLHHEEKLRKSFIALPVANSSKLHKIGMMYGLIITRSIQLEFGANGRAIINSGDKHNMFTLPSMWNLIISTIVFFIAAWYIRRYLDEQGIPKGMTRGFLVFILAYLVSWGAGEAVDWTREKIQGPQPAAQTSDDLLRLMKEVGQQQP
jgi:hypothetical protein